MLIKKFQNENNQIVKINSSEIYDIGNNNLLNNILSTKYLFDEIISFDFNNLIYSKKNISLTDNLNNYDFIYIAIIQNNYGSNYIIDIKSLMENYYMRNFIFTEKIHSYFQTRKVTNNSIEIYLENKTAISGSLNVLVRIKGYKL